MMSEILCKVHEDYLSTPHEANRLRADQNFYRSHLMDDYTFLDTASKDSLNNRSQESISQNIREGAGYANWPRLFVTRFRRLILAVSPFIDDAGKCYVAIIGVDQYLGPMLNYLAWIFFLPRLSINLAILGWHMGLNPWMSQTEKDLGVKERFWAHLERRWPELFNDMAWFFVGILSAFVVGVVASAYVGLASQAYDVVLASIRAAIEITRILDLKKEYQHLLNDEPDKGKQEQLQHQLKLLEERLSYEQRHRYLNILNHVIIFLGLMLAAPCLLPYSPIYSLSGAVIIGITTLVVYIWTSKLEQQKPDYKVTKLELNQVNTSRDCFSPEVSSSSTEVLSLELSEKPLTFLKSGEASMQDSMAFTSSSECATSSSECTLT
jgi:hypothetical protein